MKSLKMVALAGLLLLTGCMALHIQKDDAPALMIVKGLARVPIGVVTIGMSEAWHATQRRMDSWIGENESKLLLIWGAPNRRIPLNDGGHICSYTQTKYINLPGHSYTTANVYNNGSYTYIDADTTYLPGQTIENNLYRNFKINSNGIITDVKWHGL